MTLFVVGWVGSSAALRIFRQFQPYILLLTACVCKLSTMAVSLDGGPEELISLAASEINTMRTVPSGCLSI